MATKIAARKTYDVPAFTQRDTPEFYAKWLAYDARQAAKKGYTPLVEVLRRKHKAAVKASLAKLAIEA